MMLTEKYTKTEILVTSKVRQLCIDNEFYTKGDCSQYEEMFEICKQYKGDIDVLKRVAMNIIDHTSMVTLLDFSSDYYECVCQIMSMLANKCVVTWFEYEQEERYE